jgi:hypothetical protein
MLYGQIKPLFVKIFRLRLRYRRWGIPAMKPLRVVGWDMRCLLVADERVVRVYRVLWKDVHLVESERVTQVPIVQNVDHSRVVNRSREKKPFFQSGNKVGAERNT